MVRSNVRACGTSPQGWSGRRRGLQPTSFLQLPPLELIIPLFLRLFVLILQVLVFGSCDGCPGLYWWHGACNTSSRFPNWELVVRTRYSFCRAGISDGELVIVEGVRYRYRRRDGAANGLVARLGTAGDGAGFPQTGHDIRMG